MAGDPFAHHDESWVGEASGEEYWRSYADLLAGLLLVFALLLITAFHHYQSQAEPIRDLVETRREIADTLRARFADKEHVTVDVDRESGSVRFAGQVLFDVNSSILRDEGRSQLDAFADEYLPVLLGVDRFREKLEYIVVEGHTDDDPPSHCANEIDSARCAYLYNLDLSQRRALSVMTFLIERANDDYTEQLKQYVTANGRSFSEPIFASDDPSVVDDDQSRRIEIRFHLNDEEVIKQIIQRLFFMQESRDS